MDYISREAAIEAIEETDWYHQNKNKDMVHGANSLEHQAWYKEQDVFAALKSIPAADVREMKRGKWENIEPNFMAKCSNCRHYYISRDEKYEFHYCPNCGADMMEEQICGACCSKNTKSRCRDER